jgi:hypothetical protein
MPANPPFPSWKPVPSQALKNFMARNSFPEFEKGNRDSGIADEFQKAFKPACLRHG